MLKDERTKKAHEKSAQIACEAAGAIRTVASLTREKDCTEIYSRSLDKPQRDSDRVAIFSNVCFRLGLSLRDGF
jgi:ATP-binding cassette subfamily B (MDR/TAP) protein 1